MRRRRGPLIAMGIFILLIFCGAGLVGIISSAWPLVGPLLGRQLFATPRQIWDFYVSMYNAEYRGSDERSLQSFRDALNVSFAEGGWWNPEEWVALREEQGCIVSDTLTLNEGNTGGRYVQGRVEISFERGPRRCFSVAFVDEGGYLLFRLTQLPSCGGP